MMSASLTKIDELINAVDKKSEENDQCDANEDKTETVKKLRAIRQGLETDFDRIKNRLDDIEETIQDMAENDADLSQDIDDRLDRQLNFLVEAVRGVRLAVGELTATCDCDKPGKKTVKRIVASLEEKHPYGMIQNGKKKDNDQMNEVNDSQEQKDVNKENALSIRSKIKLQMKNRKEKRKAWEKSLLEFRQETQGIEQLTKRTAKMARGMKIYAETQEKIQSKRIELEQDMNNQLQQFAKEISAEKSNIKDGAP